MCTRLVRVLLLTSSLLILNFLVIPPTFVMADGDPDEVIEGVPHRGPGLPEIPPSNGNGGNEEGGQGFGDPDEFVEGKDGAWPSGNRFGAANAYNLRLLLDALSHAWSLL